MEPDIRFEFDAELWLYTAAKASWHFVTVPIDISDQIRFFAGRGAPGFGSVRVKVTVGQTSWKTSIFPDKASGCYFLPVKADIRKAESLYLRESAHYAIETGA